MLLCLCSYKQCCTQLLQVLHNCCNTDVLGVLLIYLHSPLGAARPRELCVYISQNHCCRVTTIDYKTGGTCHYRKANAPPTFTSIGLYFPPYQQSLVFLISLSFELHLWPKLLVNVYSYCIVVRSVYFSSVHGIQFLANAVTHKIMYQLLQLVVL